MSLPTNCEFGAANPEANPNFQLLPHVDANDTDHSNSILTHDFMDSSLSADFSLEGLKTAENSASPALEPSLKRKSRAWGIQGGFGRVLSGDGGRKLQCTIEGCGRIFSSKNSSTSTFNNHLVSFHGIKRSAVATSADKIFGVQVSRHPEIDPKAYPEYFERALERCFIMNGLPMELVKSPDFRKMIAIAYFAPTPNSLAIPTVDGLRGITLSEYHKYLPDIKARLHAQESIALTLGLRCSATQESLLGVVAHFVDSAWNCQSVVIGMEYIEGVPTPHSVASTLLGVLNFMGIASKLSSILAEPTDLMLGMGEILASASLTHAGLDFHRYQQVPCFAHMVVLACKAAIRTGLGAPAWEYSEGLPRQSSPPIAGKPAGALLNKVRNSIILLRDDARYRVFEAQFSEQLVPHLALDDPRHWDSTLRMLEQLVLVYRQFNYALGVDGDATNCLTEEELQMLIHIINLLKVFDDFIKAISGEKTLTLAMGLYFFGVLSNKLQCRADDAPYIHAAKSAALDELGRLFPKANPLFACAMAMDPRHKLQFLASPDRSSASAESSREAVTGEWNRRYKVTTPPKPEPSASKFEFSNSQFTQPLDELESYLSSPVLLCANGNSNQEVLKFWKCQAELFPNLSKMAKRYLAPPLRATVAEELFAHLRYLVPDPHLSLRSEGVRERALLRSWYALLGHP